MTVYSPIQQETPVTGSVDVRRHRRIRNHSLIMIVLGVFFTLFTYQYYHHGLWGKLNNYNKLPLLVLKGTTIKGNELSLTMYRPNGPDTYGSFVEEVTLRVPSSSSPVETWTPSQLSQVSPANIKNAFKYQHIKTGPWGLVVPLAAKATVNLPISPAAMSAIQQAGMAQVTVDDVSGVAWTYGVSLK